MYPTVMIAGLKIHNVCLEEAVDYVIKEADKYSNKVVVPVNADVALQADSNRYLKGIINRSDLTIPDGMPIVWMSKLFKMPLKERVSGSDVVPAVLEKASRQHKSVYILGGAEGIPEKAMENIVAKYPGLINAGTYSPPYSFLDDEDEKRRIKERISKAHPDILLVCLGCPKQEYVADMDEIRNSCGITVCAGATVDFLAGNVERCPTWMGEHGLEWFWRFTREPKRLFKRYFLKDPKFFLIALKEHRKAKKHV